jgi:hypothetical protein
VTAASEVAAEIGDNGRGQKWQLRSWMVTEVRP